MAGIKLWIRRLVLFGGFSVFAVGILGLGALTYLGIPQTAAGMAAKGVCSAAFVAGRAPAGLLADEVLPASPLLRAISVDIDADHATVSARFAGLFERRATLLPNRGCVLDSAPSLEAGLATARAAAGGDQPWPTGEASVPPGQWGAGVNAPALQSAVDHAFIGAGNPDAANARGVAVVHRSRLLVLRTAPGFAAETPLHGWSMTKTVTGMLAHKLLAARALPIDTPVVNAFAVDREPAWAAEWRADGRRDIKLSDLLYMRDGLAATEDYAPGGSVPRYLSWEKDAAAFAAESRTEVAPGARWRYLGASTNLIASVMRTHFAADADYWAYPRKALFEPIGARTAVLETDTSGNWVGSSYLWASVGDWARLGELMLRDGRWGKQQVLPPGWLKRANAASTDHGEGRGYGAQTWLIGEPNAGDCKGHGLPADTIAMMGHWGQIVAMVPSREAVIVRLGWTFRKAAFDDCAFVARVLKALPQ